jgi:hypothetical protein
MAVNPQAPREVLAELQAQGKTPTAILQNIDSFIERMWQRTTPNMQAQGKRQAMTYGLRAGGAPNIKSEAQGMVRELSGLFSQISHANLWDKATARQKINELAALMQEANSKIAGRMVILFRSGGPFLYPSSTPSDYASMCGAPSKGKWVWARGWGPSNHPSYVHIAIDPARVIDYQACPQSSWPQAYWLLSQP